MKLRTLLALVLITQVSYGQNLFTKAMTKLAKVMAPPAPLATTLDDIIPSVGIGSNLHSTELGTISQSFYKGWKTGGDMAYVYFTKKGSYSMYKIDGSVTIDGMPAEYLTSGMYGMASDANPAPRKIEIVTRSGQKASFTIEPSKKKVKLLAINGQKDNVSLDLSKDVELELETSQLPPNSMIKVSIAINQLSIKSIYDVCYTRAGSKITIPAAAFRNVNIVPGGDALYNYKKSFLAVGVETIENAKDVSGFPAVQYTSSYSDGKFANITVEPNLNKGLTAKGSDDLKDGKMEYNFFKPNAFMSRPFSQIKKVGVISFAIRGTTYHEESKTTTTETSTSISTVTRTKILTFPKQPNAVWDAVLEKMYPEFMAIIKAEFNAETLPLEKVTGTDAYKGIEAFSKDDKNTKVEFSRAFHNTKLLSAFMPISEGYGVNGANERIMNESGADALMTLTLDLQIQEDGKFVVMIPKLAFEITGKTNGIAASTKFCTGTITGKGVHTEENITPEELDKVIRRTDLLAEFTKGLKEIKEKEKANGDYQAVWNLQN